MAYQDYETLKHKRELKSELIESSVLRVPTIYRSMIALSIICSGFLALILISALVPIYEIFPAIGSLSPVSEVKIIQHEDGGQVKEVLVKEGDLVKKDFVLVTFDDTSARYEALSAKEKIIRLRMDIARLQAFVDDQPFELQDILRISPEITHENFSEYEEIINNILSYKQKQQESLSTSKNELEATITKLEFDLKNDQKNVNNLQEQSKIAKQKADMYKDLLNVAISRVAYLDAKKSYNRIEASLTEKLKQLSITENDIKKNKYKLANLISNAKKDAREEKNRLEATLLITKNSLERQQDVLSRVTIKASMDGVVSGVSVTPGTVLQRGARVLDLVPINEPLIAKLEVKPEDISYIEIGSPVQINVEAFDSKYFGFIDGEVIDVATASIMKEDGMVVYNATVALDKNYLTRGNDRKYLIPGMTVEALIVTGEKTFIKYMLKPVKDLFKDTTLNVEKYNERRRARFLQSD